MHPQPDDQPTVPDPSSANRETASPDESPSPPALQPEPEAAAEPEPQTTAEPAPKAAAAPLPPTQPETRPEPVEPEQPAAEGAAPAGQPEPEADEVEPEAVDRQVRAVEPEPDSAEPEPEGGQPAADAAAPVAGSDPDADRHDGNAAPEPKAPEGPPVPRTVAELIAATLRTAGVRLAFTVPGESFLPVLDAFEALGIRVVATRHEGAAAFAAEAYGQLTGRPAVCLGTRAVGAANLAIGVHTAVADSTPMFVLIGNVTSAVKGREAFQEVDLVGTVGRLAKWAGEIEDPAMAADTLEAAVRATVEGRPGPSVIVVPEDVLELAIPEGTVAPVVRPHPTTPDVADVRAVLHFLAGAERPVILAGAGVLRARCSNDLVRLAELLHVPVVASWRRGDVIPNDHPLYLGMTGFGSPTIVRERIEAADALLVLGARLNEPTTSGYRVPAPGQRWMHVDLEPHEDAVGSAPAPVRAIRADARAFVRAALTRLKDAVLLAEPLQARDRNNPADRAAWEAATVVDESSWTGPGIHPGRIVTELRRLLPEDAIITTDAGAFAGWAARGFRFGRPGTFLGPTSGAMGYGLPAGIAAALVHRERRVVALLGDGGLGMTLAELETAVRVDAHLVAIVFDNESYGMIRGHQGLSGSPTLPGTNLGPVDFAAVARACGARGVRVDTDSGFEPALRTALAASGPTVIHLALDPRWVSVDDHPGTTPAP